MNVLHYNSKGPSSHDDLVLGTLWVKNKYLVDELAIFKIMSWLLGLRKKTNVEIYENRLTCLTNLYNILEVD